MEFLEKIYDALLQENNEKDYFTLRKEIVVKVFLQVATIVFLGFAIMNFIVFKKELYSIMCFLAFLALVYALKSIKLEKTLNKAIIITNMIFFLFFISFLIIDQNKDFGLIWTIFVPIVLISLNGHKKGLKYSLIFYTIAFILAYNGIGSWDDGRWNEHSFIRFFVALIALLYVLYINELVIYRSNMILTQKEEQEQKYIKKLQKLAQKDFLTGIYNRRYINDLLEIELKEAKRYDKDLSVAIIDIDYFKHINDKYGHNTGDYVLKKFTQLIEQNIRETDLFGRWGGEEFIIIFTNTTLEVAYEKCLKLKNIVQNYNFAIVKSLTCSIGVANFSQNDKVFDLVEKADKALYRAKQTGRNKVIKFNDIEGEEKNEL